MLHAGTQPGLPGRRGVFSCWCKWTSGLGIPRLRSHYSTVFCPVLSFNWLSRSLICTKLVTGMGNENGKYSPYPYTYLPGGYSCNMTCRGISKMGTWKPCKHTTQILVQSTVHRKGLPHFSLCHISIQIIVIHIYV